MERQKESADRRSKLNILKQKNFSKSLSTKTLEEYAAEAILINKEQEMKMETEEESKEDIRSLDKSRKKYFKELKRVIEESN